MKVPTGYDPNDYRFSRQHRNFPLILLLKLFHMRNSLARQILEETPAETRQFVKRYGELVVRIYELLEEKGWTQKDLAAKLDKSPSEISKWLSGEHNLTLRTLTRLEVELGEDLIQIPGKSGYSDQSADGQRREE
jgi:ribosome-binding protein aMBF1 (putative translation factor)